MTKEVIAIILMVTGVGILQDVLGKRKKNFMIVVPNSDMVTILREIVSNLF